MANKNLVLRLLITAKDEASDVLSSMQVKAAAVATAVAGYFSFNFLTGAVKSAADFEAAMSRVQAATGSAGDELASLKKAAEDAGSTTRFTSVEAAQGLENLAKSGLSASKAIAALPGVLALAEAGDIALAESASIVTRTIAGMGVAAADTGRIADVLAMGANASNTSVKALGEALSYTAPTARALGLSLEQTVAYIGKFADAGIDASRAGTALNAILSQFQDPSSKFRQELINNGITTSNFDKALRALAASGAKGEKAILAVGIEAGPALRGLLNQGMGALDELKGKLDNAKGSAAETATTMGNNLNGAIQHLSSAWEALKIKLGEPVLNAVADGVKDLTARLQGAISNGTISRFGDAFKSAFGSALEWARKFAAEVDPVALVATLQESAGKIGSWFDATAEKAQNAGNIISTVWGVMTAGVNTVMGVIYKLAEAQSQVVAAMLQGVALLADGWAKITFGGVSEKFRTIANEVRIAGGGMGAVSEEFGKRASAAFDNVVEGADRAAKGWAGLASPAAKVATAVGDVAAGAAASAKDLAKSGDAAAVATGKLADLGSKADASGKAQVQAAESASASVKTLRAEYDKLVAGGDSQGAAAKLQEINKALADVKGSAEGAGKAQVQAAESASASVKALRAEYDKLVAGGDSQGAAAKLQEINKALIDVKSTAKDTADALKAAYATMGISTAAELKNTATQYKAHYEAIKADGTATAAILQEAFKKYAEKAIEANGNIAPAALRGEAAMRGLRIETDETGKAIVKIVSASGAAGAGVQSSMTAASAAVAKVRSEAEKLADELDRIKSGGATQSSSSMTSSAMYDDLRRANVTPEQMRSAGYTSRQIEDYVNQNDKAQPGFVNRTVTSSSVDVYGMAVKNGLNDAEAKRAQELYGYYAAQANVAAQGQAGGTLGLGFGAGDYAAITREYAQKAMDEAKKQISDEARAAKKSGSNTTTPSTPNGIWGNPNRTVSVNLTLNGRSSTVNVTDQSSADTLLRLLEEAGLAQR